MDSWSDIFDTISRVGKFLRIVGVLLLIGGVIILYTGFLSTLVGGITLGMSIPMIFIGLILR